MAQAIILLPEIEDPTCFSANYFLKSNLFLSFLRAVYKFVKPGFPSVSGPDPVHTSGSVFDLDVDKKKEDTFSGNFLFFPAYFLINLLLLRSGTHPEILLKITYADKHTAHKALHPGRLRW